MSILISFRRSHYVSNTYDSPYKAESRVSAVVRYCDWLIIAQGYDFSDHLAQQDLAAGFTVKLYEYEICEIGENPATKSF